MVEYASEARRRGLQVIIAGAGGAGTPAGYGGLAHHAAVIGVPVKSSNSIDGWDSVLSILQMPSGVPVATVALDGAQNAGILAAQIVGCHDSGIGEKLEKFKKWLENQSRDIGEKYRSKRVAKRFIEIVKMP